MQSEDRKPVSVAADALSDTSPDAGESVAALKPEADDSVSMVGDRGQPSTPQLQAESCTEASSPPKTPSSVSLAESVQSASHSEFHIHTCLGLLVSLFCCTCVIIMSSDDDTPYICTLFIPEVGQ